MVDELKYFNAKVWRGVATNGAHRTESMPIRTRWVLCNKGDAAHPEIRARLVACEVKTFEYTTGAFAASTPPLEAKRILFSRYASERRRNGQPLKLHCLDVRKAYLNGVSRRSISPSSA